MVAEDGKMVTYGRAREFGGTDHIISVDEPILADYSLRLFSKNNELHLWILTPTSLKDYTLEGSLSEAIATFSLKTDLPLQTKTAC